MFFSHIILSLLCITVANARQHEFHFNTSLVTANPDGVFEREMIGINGHWPLPTIRVQLHDQVVIYLENGMNDRNVSLHFHGLFMEKQNTMDGPEYVTQCPVSPGMTFTYNFTVTQTGTYWYHSHLGSQYSDGLRGLFIVEETSKSDYPFDFNEDVTLSISDHYHKQSKDIIPLFKSRYNPTGAEPIVQNSLFNETRNATWKVEPDTTYYLRIVNMGMFVSQYLYVEHHTFTIVEIDGVYVEPIEVNSLYLSVAQRYGVLFKTKSFDNRAFRIVTIIDEPMLDVLPADLKIVSTNYLSYGDAKLPEEEKRSFSEIVSALAPIDDFWLRPLEDVPLLAEADYLIVLNFTMENLGDGVTYAFFNDVSYVPPKVPTLYTVLSSGDLAHNSVIYGLNTNTFVLLYGETVEIVINNMDPGKHPFHLHGHTFQVVLRSSGSDDEEHPQIYDPSNAEHTQFPQYPMIRDTVMVNSNGFLVIRFKAENPGVWFFHCHLDWHLEQGLAITLVEAPTEIQKNHQHLPPSHLDACNSLNIPTEGNAAANSGDSEFDWLNLEGENVQPKPLPPGFTPKGYVAIAACTVIALLGVYTVYQYGMEDVSSDETEHVISKLRQILEAHEEDENMLLRAHEGSSTGVS